MPRLSFLPILSCLGACILPAFLVAEPNPPVLPDQTPVISVKQVQWQSFIQTMVQIAPPSVPRLKTEVWCYEDALGHGDYFPQPDGSMLLLHQHPEGATVITRVVPSPGVVDWYITVTGTSREAVKAVSHVNGCWQFKPSPTFKSENGKYVETFVNRCFVFTEKGLTFMRDTDRQPDPRYAPDHQQNSPPWVQRYYPVWADHPGRSNGQGASGAWGISGDHPVLSVIGVVSRDGRHLAAWAGKQTQELGQGFHDCLHLNADLLVDYDPTANRIVSHSRMYFMEFDSADLESRIRADFIENPAD